MKATLVAFISGMVFAVGLGIGGMTQPAKVIGFLDFTGAWDASLAFVMLGAIGVHSLFIEWSAIVLPPVSRLLSRYRTERKSTLLLGGSVIFGIGWGIAGFCPGPALTSLASGNLSVTIFSVAMIAGIFVFDFIRVLLAREVRAENTSGEVTEDT